LSGSEVKTPLGGEARSSTEIRALAFVSVIFFMWGLITSLNDVLIPHLKSVFDLDYAGIMLVQFMFFGAYFVASWPSGWIVARLGYPKSMFWGLVLSAVGAFLFFPAAAAPSYPMFLLALFVLASGITLLQVAANPYVSLLGPPRGSSSRLNLAQALNSLGTILGPAVGGCSSFRFRSFPTRSVVTGRSGPSTSTCFARPLWCRGPTSAWAFFFSSSP
jgi:fucose permease